MPIRFIRRAALPLLVPVFVFFAGCATTGRDYEEAEPTFVGDEPLTREEQEALVQKPVAEDATPAADEGEVPLAVAETEPPAHTSPEKLPEIVVAGRIPERFEV